MVLQKKHLCVIVALICCLSCQHKPQQNLELQQSDSGIPVIDIATQVNKDSLSIVYLSQIADSIRYIPLELTTNSLVTYIRDLYYENDQIILSNSGERSIIFSSDKCLIFNKDGAFKTEVGQRGQGPNEHNGINHIFLNTQSQRIYLNTYRKLLAFDFEGKFLRRFVWTRLLSDSIKLDQLACVNDSLLFAGTRSQYDICYRGSVWRMKGDTIYCIETYPENSVVKDANKKSYGFYSGTTLEAASLFSWYGKVRSFSLLNDTIYSIDVEGLMHPYMIIGLGKFRYPVNQTWTRSREELEKFKERLRLFGPREHGYGEICFGTAFNKDQYVTVTSICESTRYLFVKLDMGIYAFEPYSEKIIFRLDENGTITETEVIATYNDLCTLYDKQIGKVTLMKQPFSGMLGFKNDIDDGPPFFPKTVNSNDEMVGFIDAEDFLKWYETVDNPSETIHQLASKTLPDSNPIVMIAKIKKKTTPY